MPERWTDGHDGDSGNESLETIEDPQTRLLAHGLICTGKVVHVRTNIQLKLGNFDDKNFLFCPHCNRIL